MARFEKCATQEAQICKQEGESVWPLSPKRVDTGAKEDPDKK